MTTPTLQQLDDCYHAVHASNLAWMKRQPVTISLSMFELHELTSALATESFGQRDVGNVNNADRAWKLRERIGNVIAYLEMLDPNAD
jgi:hypothetical protein